MPRATRWIALALLACWLPGAGCVGALSRKYSHRVLHPHRAGVATPAGLSLPSVNVRFRSARGNEVHGWFLPNERSRAGVVILGGNTGNMSYHLLYARILWRAGFSVLLFDYQGFGKSPGRASLLSLAADAAAALKFLRAQREVDPRRVGLFGISLGSVVALHVAAETPHRVAAVVAEAPYDPREQLQKMLHLKKKIPLSLARLAARLASGLAFPAHFRPFSNVDRLTGVPLFLMHGADDGFLPATTSTRLFVAADGPKGLWLPARTGHSPELLVTQDGEYQAQLVGFFRRWLRRRPTRRARGFRWRVQHFTDGRFEVTIHPTSRAHRPRPVEIITIARGGRHFERHRVWLDGSPLVLRPERVPVSIALTHRYRPVRRLGPTWRPVPTLYTRSYRLLQGARPQIRRLLSRGLTGVEAAGRKLRRLSATRLDPRIRPRLGGLWTLYGRRLERRGQLTEALAAYTEALRLGPASPGRHYVLGAARFSVGAPRYLGWTRRRLQRLRRRLPSKPRPTP